MVSALVTVHSICVEELRQATACVICTQTEPYSNLVAGYFPILSQLSSVLEQVSEYLKVGHDRCSSHYLDFTVYGSNTASFCCNYQLGMALALGNITINSFSPVILAAGWTTYGSEFESRWDQEFSPIHIVQTGSWAQLASYLKGTGELFPRG